MEMINKQQPGFLFRPSYYEALRPLPDEARLACLDALLDYAFCGLEPELPPPLQGYFILMKPTVDAALDRYRTCVENGAKGGRPAKRKTEENPGITEEKPKQNPGITQEKPKQNPTETLIRIRIRIKIRIKIRIRI